MPETTNTKPTFEASIEATLLAERLGKAEIGEIVKYDDLSKIIGQDVRNPHVRSRLQTALKHVLKDHRFVFAAVSNVGYKRLGDADLAKIGEASTHKIARETKRATAKMACVDLSKLTPQETSRWNAQASLLAMYSEFSKPRVVKAIEQATAKAGQRLPTAKAIEAAFSTRTNGSTD